MQFAPPIYTHTARFDNEGRALTDDELRTLVPSVFATTAHESRSERFRPIPTIEVVRGLAKEGFSVVGAAQSTARLPDRRDFTKHLLRLRRLDGKQHNVGDVVPEVLLRNANDGSCSYELMAGLFRIRCMNSLVAAVSTLESTKVRHSGNQQGVVANVIEGTFRVIDAANDALVAPDQWGRITTNREERELIARAAHMARFDTADNDEPPPG